MNALTFGLVVVVLLALNKQSYAACKKKTIREKNCLNDTCNIACNNDDQNIPCYETQADWVDACTRNYSGITNGGRCFFTVNKPTDWINSWQSCKDAGGTLAQIHSNNELSAITTYLQLVLYPYDLYIWIAMMHDAENPKSLDLEKSFWYTSPSESDPNFKAGNTWIRNRVNDDPYPKSGIPEACALLWTNYQKYGDGSCGSSFRPLCVVTNTNQNFTLIHDACIAEQPMETFSTIDAKSCGQQCVNFSWCRGFNFWANNDTCQLFPWSLNDSDKPNSISTSDCYAYAYS